MNTFKVYKITNKINGKIYIGVTSKTLNDRFRQHCRTKDIKPHFTLYQAMNKYGVENFEIALITEAKTKEDMWILEIENIFFHQSFYQTQKGYNMTYGGGSNAPITEETRKKLSEATKNFFRNNPEARLKLKTKTISKETRKKLSVFNTGKLHSDESREKRRQTMLSKNIEYLHRRKTFDIVTPDGQLLHRTGIHQFCKEYGLGVPSVRDLLNGKRKTYKGWTIPSS